MQKTFECCFDPSQPEFLGGFKDRIHVKGWRWEEGQDDREDIILIIRRPVFLRMIDAYLKQKIEYCERYQHYCGAMSSITCQSALSGETELYDVQEDTDEKPAPRKVRVFTVLSYDPNCDMEHG